MHIQVLPHFLSKMEMTLRHSYCLQFNSINNITLYVHLLGLVDIAVLFIQDILTSRSQIFKSKHMYSPKLYVLNFLWICDSPSMWWNIIYEKHIFF